MNAPFVVAILLGAVALCGLICLASVFAFWNSFAAKIPETGPKIAVECVQGISAVGSIGAAYATASDEKQLWLPAAIAGCLSLLIWKTLQVLVDSRIKAAEKIDKEVQKRLKEESESRTRLLTLFREFVFKKVSRLTKAVSRGANGTRANTRSTLSPDTHLDDLLMSVLAYFSAALAADPNSTHNFRVGLYVAVDSFMRPLRAIDFNHGDYDVFTSFEAHKEHYSLSNDSTSEMSHVVKCVKKHKTIIVEDCEDAAKKGEFSFFHENQKSYLRSMLAYDAGNVHLENGRMAIAALVIDTDAPGFFKESNRESMEFALREFASRIKLEMLLHAHLMPKGKQS